MNSLNVPIERHRLDDYIKKVCLLSPTPSTALMGDIYKAWLSGHTHTKKKLPWEISWKDSIHNSFNQTNETNH